jgi:hypothetical protein
MNRNTKERGHSAVAERTENEKAIYQLHFEQMIDGMGKLAAEAYEMSDKPHSHVFYYVRDSLQMLYDQEFPAER